MWMGKDGMGILFFFHSAWGQCAIAFWRAIILLGSTSHCHLSPLRDISLHLPSCPEGVLRGQRPVATSNISFSRAKQLLAHSFYC